MNLELIHDLNRYQNSKIPTGSFLRAVLENDLGGALTKADKESFDNLQEIYFYVCNNLPSDIWGSRAAVRKHLDRQE